MFVAHAATVCAPASSNTVWSAPLVKLGTSFTAVTLITNVCAALVSTPPLAVPPLSCKRTVIVALPLAFAAGVKVRLPFEEFTAGSTLNSASLFVVTRNVRA